MRRAVRIILTALAVEVLTVLVLVLIVAVAGPRDPEAAGEYAKEVGIWVGPIGGFVLCLLGGWWVARRRPSPVVMGLSLGVAVAAIDIAILVLGREPFQAVFAISNAGRVLAGTLGGWLASRGPADPAWEGRGRTK